MKRQILNINLSSNQTHIISIDWLRGILALLIVTYHYSSWQQLFIPDSNSILSRIAIYGVSLFFIISGFSLGYTYLKKFNQLTLKKIKSFYFKRIARIYPLYWLIIFLSLIIGYRHIKDIGSIENFFLQISLTFDFFNYDGLTPGSWSIGVEIIMYTIFPFIIFFTNLSTKANLSVTIFIYIFIIVILMYISSYHAPYQYHNLSFFKTQYFSSYVHFFINHLYFFLFGILFALVYINYKSHWYTRIHFYITSIIFVSALLILFLYKLDGNALGLIIIHKERVIFSLITFAIFIFFLSLNSYIKLISVRINKLLSFLGDISYTIYLIHPLAFYQYKKSIYIESLGIYNFVLFIILLLLLSKYIHYSYELKIKKLLLKVML